MNAIIKEGLFGKSVFLMVGSLLVGLIGGDRALTIVKPLFIDLYPSILVLFLLGMGLTAGNQLAAVRKYGLKLLALGILLPLYMAF